MQVTWFGGVKYEAETVRPFGEVFVLFPEPFHTKEDIAEAKEELRETRKVHYMRIATQDDWDSLYKSQILGAIGKLPFKWQEFAKFIRKERKVGTTPEQFVRKYVIQNEQLTAG